LNNNYEFFGATHPAEAKARLSGQILNCLAPIFTAREAVRPSLAPYFTACQDLMSKAMDGSKSSYGKVKRS